MGHTVEAVIVEATGEGIVFFLNHFGDGEVDAAIGVGLLAEEARKPNSVGFEAGLEGADTCFLDDLLGERDDGEVPTEAVLFPDDMFDVGLHADLFVECVGGFPCFVEVEDALGAFLEVHTVIGHIEEVVVAVCAEAPHHHRGAVTFFAADFFLFAGRGVDEEVDGHRFARGWDIVEGEPFGFEFLHGVGDRLAIEEGGGGVCTEGGALGVVPRGFVLFGEEVVPTVQACLSCGVDEVFEVWEVRVFFHTFLDAPDDVIGMPAGGADDDDAFAV